MPHLILRGSGAGKWLPWARNKLRAFRETLDLDHFSHWFRVSGAKVGIKWAGDEEWIFITAEGVIIFGTSADRGLVVSLRQIAGGVIKPPFGLPATPFRVIRGPVAVGGRSMLLLEGLRDSPIGAATYTAYVTSDGGASMRALPIAFTPTTGFLSPAYGGPVFVDGKAVGTRYLIAATAGIGVPVLYRSEDAGQTWASTSMNFFPADPADNHIFSTPIAIGRNKLLAMGGRLVSGKILIIRSLNGGASWSALAATGLSDDLNNNGLFWLGSAPTGTESLGIGKLVALGKNKVLFFVFQRDGVAARSYTSVDGGETWSAPTTALTNAEGTLALSIRSDPLVIGPNSAVFRYTPSAFDPFGETRIVRTLDGGASWQHLAPIVPGAPPTYFGIPMLYSRSADPLKGVLMIPGFDPTPETDATYLYVSRDSGASWQRGPKLVAGEALGTTNAFFHLGTTSRPQPAGIGAKGLFDAD